jgi:chromosome segregation ATPase
MSIPSSGNAGQMPPAVSSVATSKTASLNEQITNVLSEIMAIVAQAQQLSESVKGLKEAKKSLNAQRPNRENFDKDENYTSALSAWQGSVGDLQGQIDGINEQIEKLFQDVGQAQQKVQGLESQKGAAASEDAKAMRQEMDRLKDSVSALDKAADEVSEGTSDKSSSRAGRKLEIKKIERQVPVEDASNPELKAAIRTFALMLSDTGDASTTQNMYTGGAKSAPASGLPLPGTGEPKASR